MFDDIKSITLQTLRAINVACKFSVQITDNLYKDLSNIFDQ